MRYDVTFHDPPPGYNQSHGYHKALISPTHPVHIHPKCTILLPISNNHDRIKIPITFVTTEDVPDPSKIYLHLWINSIFPSLPSNLEFQACIDNNKSTFFQLVLLNPSTIPSLGQLYPSLRPFPLENIVKSRIKRNFTLHNLECNTLITISLLSLPTTFLVQSHKENGEALSINITLPLHLTMNKSSLFLSNHIKQIINPPFPKIIEDVLSFLSWNNLKSDNQLVPSFLSLFGVADGGVDDTQGGCLYSTLNNLTLFALNDFTKCPQSKNFEYTILPAEKLLIQASKLHKSSMRETLACLQPIISLISNHKNITFCLCLQSYGLLGEALKMRDGELYDAAQLVKVQLSKLYQFAFDNHVRFCVIGTLHEEDKENMESEVNMDISLQRTDHRAVKPLVDLFSTDNICLVRCVFSPGELERRRFFKALLNHYFKLNKVQVDGLANVFAKATPRKRIAKLEQASRNALLLLGIDPTDTNTNSMNDTSSHSVSDIAEAFEPCLSTTFQVARTNLGLTPDLQNSVENVHTLGHFIERLSEYIGGFEMAKQRICELVQWRYNKIVRERALAILTNNYQSKAKLPLPFASGVMITGPSGSGKTHFAESLAKCLGVSFLRVRLQDVFKSYLGESEKAIRNIFKRAYASLPCLLFFDDIDMLASGRGIHGVENNVEQRVLSTLLNCLDGIDDSKSDSKNSGSKSGSDDDSKNMGLIVVGATSRMYCIDPALTRPGRFDAVIELDKPSVEDRKSILLLLLKNVSLEVSIDALAGDDMSGDFSCAELKRWINDAKLAALKRMIKGGYKDVSLSESDFLKAREEMLIEATELKSF